VISAGRGIYKVALPETPPGATEVWYRDAEDDFLGVGAGETSEDSTPGRRVVRKVTLIAFSTSHARAELPRPRARREASSGRRCGTW